MLKTTRLSQLLPQAWFSSVSDPSGESGTISSTVRANTGDAYGKLAIEAIKVLGLPEDLSGFAVTVNGQQVSSSAVSSSSGILTVTGLKLLVGDPLEVKWQSTAGAMKKQPA